MRASRSQLVTMRVTPEEDPSAKAVKVSVFPQFFEGTEESLAYELRRHGDEFDYGYALTVHKAQGSQWDDVYLFDESYAFREHRDRWLYTGSRARRSASRWWSEPRRKRLFDAIRAMVIDAKEDLAMPPVTQDVIDLYDRFTHGGMDRRAFMEKLAALAGGAAAASALLGVLQNDYAAAQTVAENDPRLSISQFTYEIGDAMMNGLLAAPAAEGRRPGLVVIHENRG